MGKKDANYSKALSAIMKMEEWDYVCLVQGDDVVGYFDRYVEVDNDTAKWIIDKIANKEYKIDVDFRYSEYRSYISGKSECIPIGKVTYCKIEIPSVIGATDDR